MTHAESLMLAVCFGAVTGSLIGSIIVLIKFSAEDHKEKKRSGIDCPARTIHERDLQAAVVTAVNDAWARKDIVLPALKANVQSVVDSDTDERLTAVDKALRDRQAELLDAGKD